MKIPDERKLIYRKKRFLLCKNIAKTVFIKLLKRVIYCPKMSIRTSDTMTTETRATG